MAQSRTIFRGSMEAVAEALRPFAAAASFVKPTTKLSVEYVKQHAGLLASLRRIAQNHVGVSKAWCRVVV